MRVFSSTFSLMRGGIIIDNRFVISPPKKDLTSVCVCVCSSAFFESGETCEPTFIAFSSISRFLPNYTSVCISL